MSEQFRCNLPERCDCELCQYWAENNSDLSRTPDWQLKDDSEEDVDE